MKNRPKELETLRKEIEEAASFSIESKNDFEKLHSWLEQKLKAINDLHGTDKKGEPIIKENAPSSETLMRIWEYVPYEGEILTKTWGLLARSLGYLGWNDFVSKVNNTYNPPTPSIEEVFENQRKEIQLGILNGRGIYTLGWYPEKYSKLKCLGGFEFEVIESKNMNKKTGDTFVSPTFKLSFVEGAKFPDIMLDDYGDDYFDHQREICGEFENNYFYL